MGKNHANVKPAGRIIVIGLNGSPGFEFGCIYINLYIELMHRVIHTERNPTNPMTGENRSMHVIQR